MLTYAAHVNKHAYYVNNDRYCIKIIWLIVGITFRLGKAEKVIKYTHNVIYSFSS